MLAARWLGAPTCHIDNWQFDVNTTLAKHFVSTDILLEEIPTGRHGTALLATTGTSRCSFCNCYVHTYKSFAKCYINVISLRKSFKRSQRKENVKKIARIVNQIFIVQIWNLIYANHTSVSRIRRFCSPKRLHRLFSLTYGALIRGKQVPL